MSRQYAFLMIDYDTPDIISNIQNDLSSEDLYEVDGEEYGIEHDTHVTLVPCLDNDIDVNVLRDMLEPIDKYVLILHNISMFTDKDDYDVLKCDASSMVLSDTNSKITKQFPTHSDYKEYHPHVTIAYVKKGIGDKYLKEILSPLVILKPKQFHFSFVDKNGEEKEITFK